MTEISDDAKRNREGWTQTNTNFTDAQASKSWAAAEITWGVFGVPEESLNTLGDVNGLDVIKGGVEWQLPHGELFRLLRRTGFDVVDLVELYPPDDAVAHSYYVTPSVDWSRKWPSEEIWVAEKSHSQSAVPPNKRLT
jgi:hypothetical protein